MRPIEREPSPIPWPVGGTTRHRDGKPLIWLGHRVERDETGVHRTLCGTSTHHSNVRLAVSEYVFKCRECETVFGRRVRLSIARAALARADRNFAPQWSCSDRGTWFVDWLGWRPAMRSLVEPTKQPGADGDDYDDGA